jgi:hypothetical protein
MAKPQFPDVLPQAILCDDVSDIPGTLSPTSPGVFLPAEFFTAVGLTDLTKLSNPETVILSVLLAAYDWYQTDTTEEPGLEFDVRRVAYDTDRNGQPAFSFSYGVTAYKTTTPPVLDPDDLIA